MQPEYKGTSRLPVTVCNVPAFITGECLAAYLSAYGQVEEINLLSSPAGTAYGDYTFRLCLTRDGFKAIPETLISGDRQMMVVVEGRRPRCWACIEIGHIAKFCPRKAESTTATTTTATTTTIRKQAEAQGPGQAQPKTSDQEGWTVVIRKRKGSPKQGGKSSSATSPPQKQTKALAAEVPEPPATPEPIKTPSSPKVSTTPKTPATPATPVKTASPAPLTHRKSEKKIKSTEETPMETNAHLKRKRDSGEGAAKKYAQKNPTLRQAPPLKQNHNHLPHLHHYPHHYLHHLYLHHLFPQKNITTVSSTTNGTSFTPTITISQKTTPPI